MPREDTESLIAEAAFMRAKLEETRAGLESEPLVIEYDNGGGQSGIRKNPAYDAYEALVKTYCTTVRTLKDVAGNEPEIKPEVLKFEQFAKSMRKHA